MKSFAERNSLTVGVIGIAVTAGLMLGATQYDKLSFLHSSNDYSAHFAEAGGLTAGSAVEVSGFEVGKVTGVELDGAQVLVTFDVTNSIRLGDRTEAAIKTKSLLGAKTLEVTPRGDATQSTTIPIDRTTPVYLLPDALGDLTSTISGLDTSRVSDSLATLAHTFQDTPPALKVAVAGVTRFSQTLNERDSQLRSLLENARRSTGVLAEHSDQLVTLVANTNALLLQLQTQSQALDQISTHVSALSTQLSSFIAENRSPLKPALDKLNGVLAIVDNHKEQVQQSIKLLNQYSMSLGESVGSGPFFKAYIANLIPGQFLQPFTDAAFSDLGLDPSVLSPSQRHDPQTGQPGTPALPVPYPRTGQGGAPNVTLPDAITGTPGDPRYPYRPPVPQPPPGGPPPGPPAGYVPTSTPGPAGVSSPPAAEGGQ